MVGEGADGDHGAAWRQLSTLAPNAALVELQPGFAPAAIDEASFTCWSDGLKEYAFRSAVPTEGAPSYLVGFADLDWFLYRAGNLGIDILRLNPPWAIVAASESGIASMARDPQVWWAQPAYPPVPNIGREAADVGARQPSVPVDASKFANPPGGGVSGPLTILDDYSYSTAVTVDDQDEIGFTPKGGNGAPIFGIQIGFNGIIGYKVVATPPVGKGPAVTVADRPSSAWRETGWAVEYFNVRSLLNPKGLVALVTVTFFLQAGTADVYEAYILGFDSYAWSQRDSFYQSYTGYAGETTPLLAVVDDYPVNSQTLAHSIYDTITYLGVPPPNPNNPHSVNVVSAAVGSDRSTGTMKTVGTAPATLVLVQAALWAGVAFVPADIDNFLKDQALNGASIGSNSWGSIAWVANVNPVCFDPFGFPIWPQVPRETYDAVTQEYDRRANDAYDNDGDGSYAEDPPDGINQDHDYVISPSGSIDVARGYNYNANDLLVQDTDLDGVIDAPALGPAPHDLIIRGPGPIPVALDQTPIGGDGRSAPLVDEDGPDPILQVFSASSAFQSKSGNEMGNYPPGQHQPNGPPCTESFRTFNAPGVAKDVLTVGALAYVPPAGGAAGYYKHSPQFGTLGPTVLSSRIKPEIVAPGENVDVIAMTSSQEGQPPAETYSARSGSSISAALTSGAVTLVQQHFAERYGFRPSPELTKALVVSTATDLGYGYGPITFANPIFQQNNCFLMNPTPPASSPAYDITCELKPMLQANKVVRGVDLQGFGMLSVDQLVHAEDPTGVLGCPGCDYQTLFADEPASLQQGDSYSLYFSPYDEPTFMSGPIRIALAWTDPPGAQGTQPPPGFPVAPAGRLVNDLDLMVYYQQPGGFDYFVGNNFLIDSVFSKVVGQGAPFTIPAGAWDADNNLEVVEINLPQGTNGFHVEVQTRAVVGKQTFGLSISGPMLMRDVYDRVTLDSTWGSRGVTNAADLMDALGTDGFDHFGFKQGDENFVQGWMQTQLASRAAWRSTLVVPNGVLPDTLFPTGTTSDIVFRYLTAGGRLVWTSTVMPFRYQSHWDGTVDDLGANAAQALMGVTYAGDLNLAFSPDVLGRRWGLFADHDANSAYFVGAGMRALNCELLQQNVLPPPIICDPHESPFGETWVASNVWTKPFSATDYRGLGGLFVYGAGLDDGQGGYVFDGSDETLRWGATRLAIFPEAEKVYWDDANYPITPGSGAGAGVTVTAVTHGALDLTGFIGLSSPAASAWFKVKSAAGNYGWNSVLVSLRGVVPDWMINGYQTAVPTSAPTSSRLRDYLDRGGRVVWIGPNTVRYGATPFAANPVDWGMDPTNTYYMGPKNILRMEIYKWGPNPNVAPALDPFGAAWGVMYTGGLVVTQGDEKPDRAATDTLLSWDHNSGFAFSWFHLMATGVPAMKGEGFVRYYPGQHGEYTDAVAEQVASLVRLATYHLSQRQTSFVLQVALHAEGDHDGDLIADYRESLQDPPPPFVLGPLHGGTDPFTAGGLSRVDLGRLEVLNGALTIEGILSADAGWKAPLRDKTVLLKTWGTGQWALSGFATTDGHGAFVFGGNAPAQDTCYRVVFWGAQDFAGSESNELCYDVI